MSEYNEHEPNEHKSLTAIDIVLNQWRRYSNVDLDLSRPWQENPIYHEYSYDPDNLTASQRRLKELLAETDPAIDFDAYMRERVAQAAELKRKYGSKE